MKVDPLRFSNMYFLNWPKIVLFTFKSYTVILETTGPPGDALAIFVL